MTTRYFNLNQVDASWKPCLIEAITKIDPSYLNKLYQTDDWLPGHNKIFNAFSIPVNEVRYVLLGESPYPRKQSANGYAFWDESVTDIWSEKGLSKQVNRATSLRNMIKMLLIAEGALTPENTSQQEITKLDKKNLVKTNQEFFNNFIHHGFLLLNATLVLHNTPVKKDALAWQPFIKYILLFLLQQQPQVKFILFGQVANAIDKLLNIPHANKIYAEHPYNLSFISQPHVLDFFRPLHLLLGAQ